MGNIMMKSMKKPLAIALLAALAACTGGPMAQNPPAGPTTVTPAPGNGQILVGVGDSLTAGYQSGGFLGQGALGGSATVTSPLVGSAGGPVYPGQESGFWSLMYQQMTGVAGSEVPVMPLIAGPGLGNQLVLNSTAFITGSHVQGGCDSFNAAAYGASTWQKTRLNPTATVLDLGVPGITMHEAVSMNQPLTGAPPAPVPTPPSATNPSGWACPNYPNVAGDPTAGNLQSLVNGESLTFYPVLGGFQGTLGAANLTELNAAISLKPQLATVWLGANDLLKYTFSAGLSPVSDSPSQMAADLTQIVASLKATGAKVLVADLPNVLSTPQFFPQTKFVADCQPIAVLFSAGAVTPGAAASAFCTGVGAALAANGTVKYTAGAYLTETGFFDAVSQGLTTAPNFQNINLDHNGAGSGLGTEYLTPTFAAQVQTVNTAYNTAIDAVATGSGTSVALVPITKIFNALNGGVNASTLGIPGASGTLQFGGGLVSWDGLHPSYEGYAVIAYEFIAVANAPTAAGGLGLTPAITQLSAAQIGGAAAIDPYNPTNVNPALPFPVFPLN